MGRINLIVPDEFEKRFREEVFKRKGMKRGNLTDAIIEAMELWMKQPNILDLKKIALSEDALISEKEKSIDALAELGDIAIGPLIEIAIDENVLPSVKERAIKRIKNLIGKEKINSLQEMLVRI
ncbi:MAG: hypothetical protein QXE46_00435 [Candidatus Thermoplasmatota archaeon]